MENRGGRGRQRRKHPYVHQFRVTIQSLCTRIPPVVNVSPTKTIAGVSTGLNSPGGHRARQQREHLCRESERQFGCGVFKRQHRKRIADYNYQRRLDGSTIRRVWAVDSAGNIYVSSYGTANGGSDTVTIYAPASSGNAKWRSEYRSRGPAFNSSGQQRKRLRGQFRSQPDRKRDDLRARDHRQHVAVGHHLRQRHEVENPPASP